ncbi:hypothetical protein [Sphingomonas sp. GM_Shp_1]|uniref:hypothetical protein n=1 Tax=Sphingomonas sp. GM_Shp_1 TaxID=2937381 RepID=UPI00226B5B2B|nr:hypothetical protein [Sphingomonas sp. GM_Shp_1]
MSNDPTRPHQHADRPMLLASGSKAGGSAKTSVLLATTSLALLAGSRVGIIDADATGTSAISHRIQHRDVPVIPLVESTPVSALLDQFAGCDLILFDVGANELTSPRTFKPLVNLVNLIRKRDGNAAMLVSQIPNKANIVDDMTGAVDALGDLLDIHIVQQNVDGTGAFDDLPPKLAMLPRHEVPHLTPTVLNISLGRGRIPADLIRYGSRGYERLRGAWAAHLLHVATSGDFARWLGLDAALPLLEQTARAAPSQPLPRSVPAHRLTDEVVDCWDEFVHSLASIRSATNDRDLLAAAKRFQASDAHYETLLA